MNPKVLRLVVKQPNMIPAYYFNIVGIIQHPRFIKEGETFQKLIRYAKRQFKTGTNKCQKVLVHKTVYKEALLK